MRIGPEIKIFLTFFIIFSLFVHWSGADENPRLSLIRAIVDENRLQIDSYYNTSEDRVFFNNHYYSDKDPGTSFFAMPIYTIWKFVSNQNWDIKQNNITFYPRYTVYNATIYEPVNPSSFLLNSMFLVTVFTSSFFSALTIVLIYKCSKYFIKNENYRLLLTFLFGFGTLIFPYAILFRYNALGVFFAFSSFLLLFCAKQEKIERKKYFLASGIFAAFSFDVVILNFIIPIMLFFYVISFSKKNAALFILGLIIGVSPYLIYNFTIYHDPFQFGRDYLDLQGWPKTTTFGHNYIPDIYITLRILFFPERGLLFYYPFLFFSFIGIYYFFKKFKAEATIIIGIFLTTLFLLSSFRNFWWGFGNFGPIYFSIVSAFLLIPLFYFLELKKESRLFKYIFLILIAYSIILNFTSMNEGKDLPQVENGKTLQNSDLDSFTVLDSPITNHYIPLFLKIGSRSRLLEGLISNPIKIDIRDFQAQPTTGIRFISTPFGFLTFRVQTLPIVVILLLVFLIWMKDIMNLIPKKFKYSVYLIPIVILIFAFNLETINYGENWYPVYTNETYTSPNMWMSNNGTIYLFSAKKEDAIVNISFSDYYKNVSKIYFNDKYLTTFDLNGNKEYEIKKISFNYLLNEIKIISPDGCAIPFEINSSWDDHRCISFIINRSKNFQITTATEFIKNNQTMIYNNNWYSEDNISGIKYRWMTENASMFIVSSDDKIYNLSFKVWSYYKPRTLVISLANSSKEFNIGLNVTEITLKIRLNQGVNELFLTSKEGCDVPKLVSSSNDERCLSFAVSAGINS